MSEDRLTELERRMADLEENANPMAVCRHCGRLAVKKGLMGGKCRHCGKRAGETSKKERDTNAEGR